MNLDEEVKRLLAAGETSRAATLVIQRFGPAVIAYLRALLRDGDDVEDVYCQWAEHVWKGLPSFRWRSSLRTWSLRLACNAALNMKAQAYARRVRRFRSREASEIAQAMLSSTAQRFERRRGELVELRKELTPEEQTLLFLRADQELPWGEVSDILSESGPPVSVEIVAKRYERITGRLRKLARERGLV